MVVRARGALRRRRATTATRRGEAARSDRSSSCARATSCRRGSSSSSGTRTETEDVRHAGRRHASGPISQRPAAMPPELEAVGYTGVWTAETAHDPFLPLLLAAEHTDRAPARHVDRGRLRPQPDDARQHRRGTCRRFSGGRFTLGLGSQIKPHITKRFSMAWSHPAPRMREMMLADPGDLGHVAQRHAARSSAASSTRTP